MPRWAIVVEQTTGFGDSKTWSPKVLTEVVGTREQALAKVPDLVQKFIPDHPRLISRRTADLQPSETSTRHSSPRLWLVCQELRIEYTWPLLVIRFVLGWTEKLWGHRTG